MTDENIVSQDAEETSQVLTFKLSGEVYGLEILNIREIIEYKGVTPVPMMPDFIEGMINLRGSVVPVINLALRFNVVPEDITKRTSVVILELENGLERLEIGVVVDLVNEVIDIERKDILPPPSFGTSIRTDFISAMANVDQDFLILLNMEKVLSVEELSQVEDLLNAYPPGGDEANLSDGMPQLL